MSKPSNNNIWDITSPVLRNIAH